MRKTITAVALAAAVLAPMAATAQTELSANVGWVSQYYFRGLFQAVSSASVGFDVASGGLYAGTWAADLTASGGAGSEYDLYAGYSFPLGEEASLTVGGAGYFYTDDLFDTPYIEANVILGYGPLALEYSAGKYSGFEYSFIGLTASQGAWWATAGANGADYALDMVGDVGQYLEVGYGFSAADLDFGVSGVWNDSALSGVGQSNLSLILGVSKAFTIE